MFVYNKQGGALGWCNNVALGIMTRSLCHYTACRSAHFTAESDSTVCSVVLSPVLAEPTIFFPALAPAPFCLPNLKLVVVLLHSGVGWLGAALKSGG